LSQKQDPTKSFSVEKAHKTQLCLSKKVILKDQLPTQIQTVAGVDVAYLGEVGVGAVAVLDYESLDLLESAVAVCPVRVPYIPTLLAFREMPAALAAIRKLKINPDVFLVDAHGWAHPYRCGFASYLGLALGKPTVGVAKSRLIGEPTKRDDKTVLVDKGEVIAAVVSNQGAKPIYVSVGHMVSLETAVKIAAHVSKERIPEPILQAHRLATRERNRLALESKVNIAEE
jgi:deoxyribonuclease V